MPTSLEQGTQTRDIIFDTLSKKLNKQGSDSEGLPEAIKNQYDIWHKNAQDPAAPPKTSKEKASDTIDAFIEYINSNVSPFRGDNNGGSDHQRVLNTLAVGGLLRQDLAKDKYNDRSGSLENYMKRLTTYMVDLATVSEYNPEKAMTALAMYPPPKLKPSTNV